MKRSMLGVLLVLTFVAVGIAAAPPLTFTFSNVKANKTATETDSYGINNAGTIAGDYVDSAGVQHAMILAGTKLTSVDNKTCEVETGADGIAFYAINSANAAMAKGRTRCQRVRPKSESIDSTQAWSPDHSPSCRRSSGETSAMGTASNCRRL